MNDFHEGAQVAMPTNEQELRQLRKRFDSLKQQLGAQAPQSEEFRQISGIFQLLKSRQPPPQQMGRGRFPPQVARQQAPPPPQQNFGHAQLPMFPPQPSGRHGEPPAGRRPSQIAQPAPPPKDDSMMWLNMGLGQELGLDFGGPEPPPQRAGPPNPQTQPPPGQGTPAQAQAPWKLEDDNLDWSMGFNQDFRRSSQPAKPQNPAVPQWSPQAQHAQHAPHPHQLPQQMPMQSPAAAQAQAQGQMMYKDPRTQSPIHMPMTPKPGPRQPLTHGLLTEEEFNALKNQTAALQQIQKQKVLFLQRQQIHQQQQQQQMQRQAQAQQAQAQQAQQAQQRAQAQAHQQQQQQEQDARAQYARQQQQQQQRQQAQAQAHAQAQAQAQQQASQAAQTQRAPSRQSQSRQQALPKRALDAQRHAQAQQQQQQPLPVQAHAQIQAQKAQAEALMFRGNAAAAALARENQGSGGSGLEQEQKKLQLQQWAAQQQQEEEFMSRRYPENETLVPNTPYVVPAGQDPSLGNRSMLENAESPLGTVSKADETPTYLKKTSMELIDRFGFVTTVDPSSLLPKEISFDDFCRREELVTIPSLLPFGVSAQGMRRRREWEIGNDIAQRRQELEAKSGRTIDEQIELKRLQLYKYLRAVRGDLLTAVQYFDSTSIDRSNRVHFARLRRLTVNEAALVEQIYNQQNNKRFASSNIETSQTKEATHVRKTLGAFVAARKHKQQFLEGIVEYQQNQEREERKKLERSAKQRLQALRANDEEAYIKLLDQIKDTRITHLLKQTNLFLDSLAEAVRTQQSDTLRRKRLDGEPIKEEELEAPNSEQDREKIDYFEVAHRIKEEVKEQPSILVGGTLKEYQLRGLQWMVSLYNNNLNGILADEMGLGKTIQSIALISYLFEVKQVKGPFLVLVPLSTLTNWTMEFETWAPSLKRVVYKGPPPARRAQQAIIRSGDFNVLLTTYEYVIKDRPVLSRIKWEHMIIDEGHRMKNSNSKLSSTLTQYYSTKHRIILTGTPLQNNLPELWALLNFVLPKIFNSIKSFDEWFNKPFATAGSNDKIDLSEEETLLIIRRLHKVLRPFLLRRLKKDVEKFLPNKTEKVIKCKMSSLQGVMYQQLLRHNALFFANDSKLAGVKGLNNRIIQLRKLCNHPFVFEEVENAVNPSKVTNDLLWRVSGKFELLDRVLPKFKATGHRVLIFFQMTQIMDIMEDFLRYRGYQFLRLDGTTKSEDRSELLRLFNDPDSPYFCFLLSTRAGGLGLNLQTADTVIIYDTDWNPHQDLQAQDRAHRIGQTKEVRILRLITENSIEENILERARGKLKIDGKVIQAGKFDNKSTSEEQEAFLRSLLEAEDTNKGHEEEELFNDVDDEELNGMLARNEDERELFAKFDRDRVANNTEGEAPRLFTEQELPEVCTDAYLQRQLEAEQLSAASNDFATRRQRKQQINYSDERALDIAKKKKVSLKRQQPPSGAPVSSSAATGNRREEYPSDDSPATPGSVQPVGKVRRQGRPPKVKETLSASQREELTNNMYTITDRIRKAQAPDGRNRIDLFIDFPSKRLYPDYYQVVVNPIAVTAIEKRIQGRVYQQIDQFAFDWRLMFANARRYNEEGSFVYEDANALEEIFIESFRKLYDRDPPQHPQAPQPLQRPRGGAVPPPASASAAGAVPSYQVPQQVPPQMMPQQMLNRSYNYGNPNASPMHMPMGVSGSMPGSVTVPQVPSHLNVPPSHAVGSRINAPPPINVPGQLGQLNTPRSQGTPTQVHTQPLGQATATQSPMPVMRQVSVPQVPQVHSQVPGLVPQAPHVAGPAPHVSQAQVPQAPQVPQVRQPPSQVPTPAPASQVTPGEAAHELDLMNDNVFDEMLDMGDMQGFDVDNYLVGNGSLNDFGTLP